MPKKYLAKIGETNDAVLKDPVLIPISIGQPYHQGEKLKALFELHASKISSSKIILADTIHHFTYQLEGLSQEEAYVKADKEGQAWKSKHQKLLTEYKDQIEVSHWDTWIKHPEFAKFKKIIDDCIDPEFKSAVDTAATSFIITFYNHIKIDQKKAKMLCIEYVKEEAAVILLWSHLGHQDMLYPRTQNNCNRLIFDSIQIISKTVSGPACKLVLHDIGFDLKNSQKNEDLVPNGHNYNPGFLTGHQHKKPQALLTNTQAPNDIPLDDSSSDDDKDVSAAINNKRVERPPLHSLNVTPSGSPTGSPPLGVSPPKKTQAIESLALGFFKTVKGDKETLTSADIAVMVEFSTQFYQRVAEVEASKEEANKIEEARKLETSRKAKAAVGKQRLAPADWMKSPVSGNGNLSKHLAHAKNSNELTPSNTLPEAPVKLQV